MPFTPFHFGLGAALHAAAPQRISFLGFCAANVLIDIESLVNLVQHRHPVHAFFHSFVGATLIIPATLLLFLGLRWLASRVALPDLLRWRQLSPQQVGFGAALGAWSHVVLDGIMHADIQPLAPFSPANPLRGAIPIGQLHLLCLGMAAAGLIGVALRQWWMHRKAR